MADKRLTARVRLNTSDFEQKLKRIARSIDALNRAVGKQSNAYNAVNKALGQSEKITAKVKSNTDKAKQSTNKWATSLNAVNAKLKQSKSLIRSIGSKLSGLASKLIGIGTVTLAIQGADTLTGSQNRFNNIAAAQLGDSAYTRDSSGNITGYSQQALDFTQETMDKIYASAQKTRVLYSDMLHNVSRTMTLAPEAFGGNIDNAIRFQEIMAEAYAVGGAEAREISMSMYQLTQALGSGVLQGEELKSMSEGASLAYHHLEDFVQGVLDTDESLKELASQGKVTSDMVVAGILAMGDEMDQAFALTKYRFSEVWNQIKSAAQKAFSPVVEMLTDKLNEAVENGLIQKFEAFFNKVANFIIKVYNIAEKAVNWIKEHWETVRNIAIIIISAIITFYLIKTAVAIACAVAEAAAWLAAHAAMLPLLGIIAVIIIALMSLLAIFLLWKIGAIDTCQAITMALIIVGAAIMIIGVITGNLVLLIIGLIIALVGVIIYYLDYILAAMYSAAYVLWNLWFTFCQAMFEGVILPLAAAWDQLANGLGNIFVDPIGALIGQFKGLATAVLSICETIARGIDAVFGSNLSAAVQGWVGRLPAKVDELVAKYGNGKYTEKSNLTEQIHSWLSSIQGTVLWDTSSAWNTGMQHGATAQDWINSLGSKFQSNGYGSALNGLKDKLTGLLTSGTDTTLNPDSVEDLLNNLNNAANDAANGANKSADNTGKMADSLELAEEDLSYLRKVAEMEWKKEFTTASIKVDMSNYNTLNGESDLDGIVTKLADKLYEEMNIVANGVYT